MNDTLQHGSRQRVEELVERYRRSSRRATLIAVAALVLALSAVVGVWLSRSPSPAKAGDGEVNSELSSAFIEIARAVEPSVVNVSTVTQPAQPLRRQNELNIPRNSIEQFELGSGEQARRGNGSGVIVDAQGYILTNYHVIDGADRIKVRFYDGSDAPGKVIGSDRETDLAVVKVEPVASMIATSTGDYNGISFAIPSSEAISVYKQLVKQGRVIRGFLGAMPDRVTPQIAKIYGLPAPRGAIISNVEATVKVDGVTVESPAAKAGLKQNDVIVEFRGERVKDNEDLVRRVASTPVGTTAPVKIYRDGRPMALNVVIGRRPGRETIANTAAASASVNDLRKESLGVVVANLSSQLALDADLDGAKGVLVQRVDPGSVADDAGLKVNDVIETINRETIDDKEDFKRVLNRLKSGDPIVLLVRKKSLAPYPRIFISLNKP